MKKKATCRYIVTDIASIPVCRLTGKFDAYRTATGAGWGVVEWYSPINNYSAPVNRDKSDKSQVMYCDEDSSATLYPRWGREYCISPYEEINLKNAPKQPETEAIIISDSCGFTFWEHEQGDVKIFVTYDENGLVDTYRFDNWTGKPYEGETEITFDDLQSEEEYDSISRVDIVGTLEYERSKSQNQSDAQPMTIKEIEKALHSEGEVKVGNVEIVMDGVGGAEVSRSGQYLFGATHWAEVEDFLVEEGIA